VLSGATVKLMTPQFVKPYVKSNKNDASDAEATNPAIPPASSNRSLPFMANGPTSD
jgi:hypothetical protein